MEEVFIGEELVASGEVSPFVQGVADMFAACAFCRSSSCRSPRVRGGHSQPLASAISPLHLLARAGVRGPAVGNHGLAPCRHKRTGGGQHRLPASPAARSAPCPGGAAKGSSRAARCRAAPRAGAACPATRTAPDAASAPASSPAAAAAPGRVRGGWAGCVHSDGQT